MLEDVLQHLSNWFLVPGGVYEDTYLVEGGTLALPFLVDGQYFRICGSLFNDGLHRHPAEGLTDETFEGTVWALAVPKQVITLADEIRSWQDKQGEPSPYTSESFGGYSYTKATNASGQPAGWQDVFKPRLNRWRKLREDGPVEGVRLARGYKRPWNPDYPFGGE